MGFKVKVPDSWNFIPASPDEGNAIGHYQPKSTECINIGGQEILCIKNWMLVFDRRASSQARLKSRRVSPDIKSWIEREARMVGTQFFEVQAKETKIDGTDCVEYIFEGKSSPNVSSGQGGQPVYVYAMLYKLSPELEFALAFNAPAEKRKWSKWRSPLQRMAKSFKRLDIETPLTGEASGIGSGSLRAGKRARLQAEVARTPGWNLFESPNYFVVSNNRDEDFVEELMSRLEAIREVYEQDYPVEKAIEARRKNAAREQETQAKKEERTPDEDEAQRTAAEKADPMEQSRTSVARVCATQDEYHSYGGPRSTSGYWASGHEELVLYDAQANQGRNSTWMTLNHEAFHQYIFYFYGNIAPHSWYNEGTGDYYAGYQLDGRGKFQLDKNSNRVRLVEQNLSQGKYCPLKEFVRWTQAQYYERVPNDYGVDVFDAYAQGWSFIYFLRTGKKSKAKGWNAAWDSILDTYLDALAETGDLDLAVDTAFVGVDWNALEQAWKAFYQ
jgi:hypothetical protein